MTAGRQSVFLVDAHHLGMGQTGNETWTRNMVMAMTELATGGELQYAVTARGREELRRFTDAPAHIVSSSSGRRLLIDLPRVLRATESRAVLVTYTAPLSRCPSVVAVHDISPWHPDAREWMPAATRTRHRFTVGVTSLRATRVVVPSQATRQEMITRLRTPSERITVVPCAVDIELTRLLDAASPRPPDGRFQVVAIGSIVPRKNLVMLARAVQSARDAGLPGHLRIVGPVPPAGTAIADEISGILGPAVEIVGYVTEEQLAAEYKSADVVCFPSVVEGFGFPIIEAMAAGVPVMVSDAAASREVAGTAGLVCGAHDLSSWRDGLLALWASPERRETMRRQGLERASTFSWHESAAIVLDALRAAGTAQTR